MSKYNTKTNKKYLGLLNFEGDVFRAYRESEDKYTIIDDDHEFILTTDENGVRDVLSGKILLTTSGGRTYKISEEHQNARPKQDAIDKFFDVPTKVDLELWESVQYRMDEEGFDYCFESYSNWDDIKDDEFHRLRKKFLRDMKELRNYINTKVDEGREEELYGE